jgi:hypothetical protein
MKYFQEVTEWNCGYDVPNHIYYMNDAKTEAVGYIPAGKKRLIKFSKPMKLDTKGRKFVKLSKDAEPDSVYFEKKTEPKPAANVITVEGSKGNKYFVSVSGTRYTCTCPGFSFRGKCKHVESVK